MFHLITRQFKLRQKCSAMRRIINTVLGVQWKSNETPTNTVITEELYSICYRVELAGFGRTYLTSASCFGGHKSLFHFKQALAEKECNQLRTQLRETRNIADELEKVGEYNC